MHCYLCATSFIFLFAMVYMTVTKNTELLDDFKYSLRYQGELQERYDKIVRERRNIYYQGFIIGIVLSIIVLFLFKMNMTYRVCSATSITFTITYFYYLFKPKSDYMVLHMNDPRIREKWLDVYKHMQFNNHMGFFLGIVFIMMFAAGYY
jgi:hypothetical protein